jgi:hypothetical protein
LGKGAADTEAEETRKQESHDKKAAKEGEWAHLILESAGIAGSENADPVVVNGLAMAGTPGTSLARDHA